MHEVDHRPAARRDEWVLWGSELSPFALKIEAMLRFAALPYRWLPAAGGFLDALRFGYRRQRVVAGRLPLTWPLKSELDEFPLVPFLFGPHGENLYDSSAIAVWLDAHGPHPNDQATAFLPAADPAVAFAVRLIDEALDEIGLYMVHHNRWVVAARDNNAGVRLANEMRPLYGPLAIGIQYGFPARQVRRLPYLFSVAPASSSLWDDLPTRLRPHHAPGFLQPMIYWRTCSRSC